MPNASALVRLTALAIFLLATGAAAAAQDRPLPGEFAEVCRVGGMDAPEWAFFDVSSVGFDAAGNLHILDADAGQIVVMDSQCDLVRTVSRKGEGPGELNMPFMLAVWRDGRIAVMDVGQAAYQVFAPDGKFERLVRLGSDRNPMAGVGGMSVAVRAEPAGDGLIVQGIPAMAHMIYETMAGLLVGDSSEERVDDRGLERIDLAVETISTTPVLQGWRPALDVEEGEIDIEDPMSIMESMMNAQVSFEPGFHWDLLPDGSVVWSDSTAYAIKFSGPGGSVGDVVERPYEPEPVTASIQRRTIDEELARMEEIYDDPDLAEMREAAGGMFSGINATMRRAIEDMRFHNEVPVVRGLKATWDGGVWVRRRGSEPSDDEGPIDVFTPDRAYAGTLDGERAEMPAAFGPDGLVAYWELGEFDVPTMVLKRLPEGIR